MKDLYGVREYISEYPVLIELEYCLEQQISEGRLYPVRILSFKFQGVDIERALDIVQILDLQREIFKSLSNEQKGKWAYFVGPYKGD